MRGKSRSQYFAAYIIGSSSNFHPNTEVLLCITKIKSLPNSCER